MKNFITIIFLLISVVSFSQSKFEIPINYKLSEIPKNNSEEHRQLNYSKDISIKLVGNKIKTFPTPRKTNSEIKFKNGLLIGSDNGEWGGKLVFKSAQKEILIKEGNIISLFDFDGKIYFMEGLAHLSTNYGEIYEVKYSNEKFSYNKVLKLTDEPQVFKIYENKIYIATFENFIIINNWKIEKEIKGFWESLYPNSIIIENDKHIFIGIRGGIVEIMPEKKIIKLYKKGS